MKTITICNKEYKIKSSAYTRFLYKKIFNKKLFEDLGFLNKFKQGEEKKRKELEEENLTQEEIEAEIGNYMLDNIDDLLDVLLRLAYIFILSADENIESYEEWLKSIESIQLSDSWVTEVTELAVDSFRG